MKTNLVRAVLACAALAFTTPAAFAGEKCPCPIPGISVALERSPTGIDITGEVGMENDRARIDIARGTTDADGRVTFRDLKLGKYFVVIKSDDLIRTMDKLYPPAKKSSGSSFSIGVGGMFGGGGSHHANEGGGPVGGSHNDSHDGGSTGGVGLGVNVPLGGGSRGAPDTFSQREWTGELEITIIQGQEFRAMGNSIAPISIDIPYCRDSSGEVRIGFTVPPGGGPTTTVSVGLGAQWTAHLNGD